MRARSSFFPKRESNNFVKLNPILNYRKVVFGSQQIINSLSEKLIFVRNDPILRKFHEDEGKKLSLGNFLTYFILVHLYESKIIFINSNKNFLVFLVILSNKSNAWKRNLLSHKRKYILKTQIAKNINVLFQE